MNIVIVNTFDLEGGAARAANRLHCALKTNDADCNMIVLNKKSSDPSVLTVSTHSPNAKIDKAFILQNLVQRIYFDSSRTELSNTLFSFAYPGYDISSNSLLISADVINLHWISFFQSPYTINRIMQLGKPVVWTLHDMCPFTGGCHYSAGCDGYTRDCKDCPQLSFDPYFLPNVILRDKSELFGGFPLTIVSPSNWLADCARNSTLFRNCRIEVIPNSIETNIFRPISKNEAKATLGINTNNIVLMFGADSNNEKRKGFVELETALAKARMNSSFEELVRKGAITIVSLGPYTSDISKLGIDFKSLGRINDDGLIACAYSAADIFILPSVEDNLPNMMLESMACGTPVLAFSTGGIPDVVKDGVNGCLVPVGNVGALSEKLIMLVSDKSLRESFGSESSDFVHSSFSPKIQADRYKALFEDLFESSSHRTSVVENSLDRVAGDSIFCMEYGPNFEKISHKIMLDCLLKSIPDICNVKDCSTEDQCLDVVNNLQEEIYSLKQSISWRITKPLRWLGDKVRGMAGSK